MFYDRSKQNVEVLQRRHSCYVWTFLWGVAVLSSAFCGCGNPADGQKAGGVAEGVRSSSSAAIVPMLVRVPSGDFTMGAPQVPSAYPPHKVEVAEFYIGKYEVTNEEFARFVDETGYITSAEKFPHLAYTKREISRLKNWRVEMSQYPDEGGRYPVVFVSYKDAIAYIKWLNAKVGHEFRLPREDEWEKAARGGLESCLYVWGNTFERRDHHRFKKEDPMPLGPLRVGETYPPNEFGLFNMSGNVAEICSSLYTPYPYDMNDGRERPHNQSLAELLRGKVARVVRGKSYCTTAEESPYYRIPIDPDYSNDTTGFRLAASKPVEFEK